MLNQNCGLTRPVGCSPSYRDHTEDIEATRIGIRTGFFSFTENVERPKLVNTYRYFGIPEVFATKFLGQFLFKFSLG